MKYALVTGAGRGLGKGFVEYLINQGYFVFAGVRKLDKFTSSDNVQYLELNVSDDLSIDKCYAKVASQTDHLDLLINNAGVNKESVTNNRPELVCKVKAAKRDLLLEMFNINSVSPLLLVQKFLPILTNCESFVINISSCRASYHDEFENNNPNYGYSASKAALNMITYGLAKDLPKTIKVFAVHPGSVKTDMNKQGDQTPLEQAENIIKITKNWKDENNGKFFRYSGELYPL